MSVPGGEPPLQFCVLNTPPLPAAHADLSQPLRYQIRVEGHLGPEWANWFEGVAIILEPAGTTRIDAAQLDQAGLFGMLKKVRDLGMPLISVVRVASQESITREESTGEGNR